MRILIVVFLLIFSTNRPSNAENLRIATFNINWGNVNLRDIKRAIGAADADVICIQESTKASEQAFRAGLNRIYRHIEFVGYQGRYKAERFGFLSKFPLKELKYVPPAHGLFGTYYATIIYADKPTRIANVHLSPFGARRGSNLVQAIQSISAVEAVHEKEIKTISAMLQPQMHTLVCGDFNSLSSLSAPKHLVSIGFRDSFAAANESPDQHPTWRWPVGNTHIQFRIDFIFHSAHFTTISAEIIPTVGSDHYLVVSELKLNSE